MRGRAADPAFGGRTAQSETSRMAFSSEQNDPIRSPVIDAFVANMESGVVSQYAGVFEKSNSEI
jgi:hypothetical protein